MSYMIFFMKMVNNIYILDNLKNCHDIFVIESKMTGLYRMQEAIIVRFIIREFTWRINIAWISCLSTFNKYGGYRASTEDYINFHNFHNWELRRRIIIYKITIFWRDVWFTLSSRFEFDDFNAHIFIELYLFEKKNRKFVC